MKYCPKCKKLYNDTDMACSCPDCKKKPLETIVDEATSVYLCDGDVIERDRVQAALEDSGIPSTYARHMVSGNSQVVTGVDMDNFDILVPYELYEKAYDVAVGIGAIKIEGTEIVEDNYDPAVTEEFEEMSRSKRTTVRVLSAILFIIVLALIIYGTDFITAFIKSLFG
jgi:predicted  nucleic acid-binding Zn-ribbon protein